MGKKSKKFLAVFLAMTLFMAPAASLYAQSPENQEQLENELLAEMSQTSGSEQGQLPKDTGISSETQGITNTDKELESVGEGNKSATDEVADTSQEQTQNGQKGDKQEDSQMQENPEKQEDSQKQENKETSTGKVTEQKAEAATETEAAQVQVQPEASMGNSIVEGENETDASTQQEEEEFVITKAVSKTIISGLQVEISTDKAVYDRIYIGNKNDTEKAPIVVGEKNEWGGYTFQIDLPLSKQGQRITLVPGIQAEDFWYDKKDVFLDVPIPEKEEGNVLVNALRTITPLAGVYAANDNLAGTSQDTEIKVVKTDGEAFKMFVISECTATVSGDKIKIYISTDNTSFDKLYLGSKDDADKEPTITGTKKENGGWNFEFDVPLEKKGTSIPIMLGKPDGSWYTKNDLKITIPNVETPVEPAPGTDTEIKVVKTDGEEFKMFVISECTATVSGDKIKIYISTDNTSFDKLYLGSKDDADKEPTIKGTKKDNDGWSFQFDVPLEKKGTSIPITLGKPDGSWYTKNDLLITIPDIQGSDNPDSKPEPEPEPVPTPGIVEDGSYNVNVDSSASMFRVVDCVLTSRGGKMSAVVTLSGVGYDYLYLGTATEAANAAASEKIHFVEDANGKYTYLLPIAALDTPIAVAAHSIKNNQWYNRTLTFKSEGMKKITGDGSSDNGNKPDDEKKPDTGGNSSGNNQGTNTKPSDNTKPDDESQYASDLSGTTSQVDNSTSLKDGVYTPDRFAWSGGTGRVSISCSKVTVTNGQAYATIVFGSDAYVYVKANGNIYYGTKGSGTTTFVIPVQLNTNNQIVGMSTKMSASHEIAYSIFVYLAAANGDGSTKASSGNEKLDEEAPQIMGLEYQSETKLDYANYFKLFHYEQGITLLEIDMTTDTARNSEKAKATKTAENEDSQTSSEEEGASAESVQSSEAIMSGLYEANIVKYLIVPENVEIPVGLDQEMIVVQAPVDKSYVAADEALKLIDEISAVEKIAAVGCEEDECRVESIVKAMQEEKISFAGTFDKPDYKTILKNKCNLAVLPSEILPKEENEKLSVDKQNERLEEIYEHFSILGIPMIVDRSEDEKEVLAKYEWIKVYGALFNCEDKASALFDKAVAENK